MRLRWTPGRRRFGIGEVYLGIGLAAIAAARFFPFETLGGAFRCPLYGLTGVPCFTCGFTRAFVRTAHLHLSGAFEVSPLGMAVFLFVVAYCVYDLLRLAFDWPWPKLVDVSRFERWTIRFALLFALLGNWAYLLVRHFVIGDWG